MGQSLFTVEALRLKPSITKHLRYLCVFLPVFPEDQLTLVIVVLVLSTSPVFASLLRAVSAHGLIRTWIRS